MPELGIGQREPGGVLERDRGPGRQRLHIARLQLFAGARDLPAHTPAFLSEARDSAIDLERVPVSTSVDARISARWIGRTPVRWRWSEPPMCMRHELSAAAQYSARVSSTERTLSASIAIEVSAFLKANVPPEPQLSSASGNSTRSIPRTRRKSRCGASPIRNIRSEWEVGWNVTRCGK